MKPTQTATIEKIRANYTTEEKTKLDELKELDKKVKRPASIFGYTFGTIGALVLGTGMCLAMKVIGNSMPLGIAIGLVGIGMVTANYFAYRKILQKRRRKYSKQIIELSDSLLN